MALALTSSSRANSLMRTWFASFMRSMDHSTVNIQSQPQLNSAEPIRDLPLVLWLFFVLRFAVLSFFLRILWRRRFFRQFLVRCYRHLAIRCRLF